MLDPKWNGLDGIEHGKKDTFEWDGGDSAWKQHQDMDNCRDSSLTVNAIPVISIKEALAKFNGYDITGDGVKRETPEEKLERIRREIKELELENVSGTHELQADLNSALKKASKPPAVNAVTTGSTDSTPNLELRISTLEKALGSDSLSTSQSQNLFDRCTRLTQKMDLLEPQNLANLEQKMATVLVKMDRVSKGTMSDDQIGKMDEMERLVIKLSTQVPIIPILTDRLETLKRSHEKAALSLSRNTDQAAQIEQMSSAIAGLESGTKNLEGIVKYNTEVITTNLKVLEERIAKLDK